MDKPTSNGRSDSAGASNPRSRILSGDADPAAGISSGGGVFDYDLCLSRLGGDRELFDEISVIFLEDAPRLLAQASASLAEGDPTALERAAHTLKGLSANFAAAAAVTASYTVELHAREHRLQNAGLCFPQLEAEMRRLEAALRTFRQQHR